MTDIDDAPWSSLAARARRFGPVPFEELREGDVDHALTAPTLVGLPAGPVSHLVHVLEGQWFSQRVRARTGGRNDLWVTSALAPLVTVLIEGPLPLRTGGELRVAEHFQQAVVGPDGWLPDVESGGLVALRIDRGQVEVAAVDQLAQDVRHEQDVRELLARHYRNERWFCDDEPTVRHTLTRAVASSVLEHPSLFVAPLTPLDELLRDPLQEQHQHHWRDTSAWQQLNTMSFSIVGMPEALHIELTRRADVYGMSLDQYVIAVLGHLAWRTPFAEDMEPFDNWLPPTDELPGQPGLRSL